MITNVRSTVLCLAVDVSGDGGANYIGVVNSRIASAQRPVMLDVWVAIQAEIDGRATPYKITIEAPGGFTDESEPREVPAGRVDVDVRTPIFAPITAEGDLVVTLTDLSRKGRSYETRWRVTFDEGHRVLTGAEIKTFADTVSAELKRRGSKTAKVIKLPPR